MKQIPTLTTYLEMLNPEMPQVDPPDCPLRVEQVLNPSVEQYRFLYNSVGKDYYWVDRDRMADEALRRILADPGVEIYVLTVEDQTAGFAELDCRDSSNIELAYFGLFPAFIGRGLGKYFLRWAVHQAWSHSPRRVWVHTCDLDHPAALDNYLKAGFVPYDQETIHQIVPED